MIPRLDGAVELLGRSLDYTCEALAGVSPDVLARPTPCSAWTLDRLLEHMEDALDAFTEAAGGTVSVRRDAPRDGGVGDLRVKACRLHAAWAEESAAGGPGDGARDGVRVGVRDGVRVGDRDVASGLLVATAALEVTVHGWDVAQTTGRRTPIPVGLAADLLPVARLVVAEEDRGLRFDRVAPTGPRDPADVRLLAQLGRHLTGPPRQNRIDPGPRRRDAS
ncbi:MAG: maleylpyruvate isomerase family mycothiol-dependent enzyme [Nocardioides sp.]